MAFPEDSDFIVFCIQISIGILFLAILITLSCYCKSRANTSAVISSVSAVELGHGAATLRKLPELQYSRAKSTGGDGECSICLTEFREKERLRLLPMCGHVFHITCVDQWLRRQTTCPMCRISAFPIPLAAAAIRFGRQSC